MQSKRISHVTLKAVGVLAVLFGLNGTVVQGAVFDGGAYSQDKVASHTDLGTDGPEPQPSNFAFEQDRFSSAPVGKSLYVLGEDNKCYWGNFAYNKYEKALIVYYKSPISNDRCLYQKQLDSKPSGYSISAKMGGVCVPTLGVGEGVTTNGWKLEEVGNPVAFSFCVDQTVSFGDNFKGDTSRQVADTGAVTTTATATAAFATATAAAPVVAPAAAAPFSIGPSVQESNVPWKSGEVYRGGFASLNNEAKTWHGSDEQAAAAPVAKTETAPPVTSASAAAQSFTPAVSAIIPDGIVTKSNEGGYTIQISSVLSREEATKETDKLKARGVADTWIMQADVRGTTYYRVCTGHYKTNKDARAAQPKVAIKSGVKNAFIQKVVDRTPASGPSEHD